MSYQGIESTNKNITNNDLLDIEKEMHKLEKNEEIFYTDQSSIRKFRISEEIDEELELSRETDEKEQEEESFIFDNSLDEVTNTSVRVSPDDKKITLDRGVQAFIPQSVTPEAKKCKKTSEKVQNAFATVSYRSVISVPKARVAFQAVCGILYGHKFLLNPPPEFFNRQTFIEIIEKYI